MGERYREVARYGAELSDHRCPDLTVAKLYNMLPACTSGVAAKRTAADNLTVRNVFVVGPESESS
jgi:hypothetical protein